MYTFLLNLHNIFRWVALIFIIYALFRTIKGLILNGSWNKADKKAGLFMIIGLDIQFLLGILLYIFYSPWVKLFFNNIGDAMKSPLLRFYGVEHIALMLLSIILGHIGYATSKKDIEDKLKFKRISIFYGLVLFVIILGVPWSRPLIPTF